MASATRIYRIDEIQEATEASRQTPAQPRRVVASFLVRASSQAQAVGHVAKRFKCEVASQNDLIDLITGQGIKVQNAGDGDSA